MLWTRTWARGVAVTNSYDVFGDLVEQDYNDGTPSVLYNNYSRTGEPREIVDASGTNELAYDYANRLLALAGTNGFYNGIIVSNHFNPAHGRDTVAVLGLSSSLKDS